MGPTNQQRRGSRGHAPAYTALAAGVGAAVVSLFVEPLPFAVGLGLLVGGVVHVLALAASAPRPQPGEDTLPAAALPPVPPAAAAASPPDAPTPADAGVPASALHLLDAVRDRALILLDADGNVEAWSAGAEALFAVPRDLAIGRPMQDHIPGVAQFRAHGQRLFAEAAREGHAATLLHLVRPGAEPWWAHLDVYPTPGPRRSFALVVADVTAERQRAEAEAEQRRVVEAAHRAEEATRTRGEFITNVTHELRSPTIQVMGLLQLLEAGEDGPLTPAQKRLVADAVTSARHLERLVEDTLDLARVEAGRLTFRPELFPVADALQVAAAAVGRQAADADVRIEVEVEPSFGEARLDPHRFRQAIVNFLSNAVRFSPPGGVVKVRGRSLAGEWFRVEVEDAGPGIPAADVPRLFTDFGQLASRTSRVAGGSGLGLALTRRLIETQTGRVGVQAGRESGCVFFAVLPRRPVNITGERRFLLPPHLPTILVAEPDPERASALLSALQAEGMHMHLAESGEALLERAETERFDGVLLPLVLPDMTGLDVVRTLRTRMELTNEPVVMTAESSAAAALETHGIRVTLDPSAPAPLVAATFVRLGIRAGTAPQRHRAPHSGDASR